MSFVDKIKTGSKKAMATAVIGGGLSIAFLGGLKPTVVMGTPLPKFLVSAAALGVSSFAADMLVPHITPLAAKLGVPVALQPLENVAMVPLLAGITVLGFEMLVAPELIAQSGGAMSCMMTGAASSVGAYYLLDSLHIISN